MKTMLLLGFLIISLISFSQSTISNDSLLKRIDNLEMQLKTLKAGPCNDMCEDFFVQNMNGNPNKEVKIIKKKNMNKSQVIKQLPLSSKILVLSPLAVIAILMLILCLILKRAGFSLREALSSKKTNPDGQINFFPSSSKLFAFLSIIAGIVFASFIFTFYMYFAFKHLPTPNFLGLWPIVLVLFIGVLPYLFQSMFKK